MPFLEPDMPVYRTQLDTPEHLSRLGFMNETTLQQTFNLLRDRAPAYALLIQNVLASEHLILRQKRPYIKDPSELAVFYRVAIEPECIVKILGLLTQLGQEMASSSEVPKNDRQCLKKILRNWSFIGDWIIKRALGATPSDDVNSADTGAP